MLCSYVPHLQGANHSLLLSLLLTFKSSAQRTEAAPINLRLHDCLHLHNLVCSSCVDQWLPFLLYEGSTLKLTFHHLPVPKAEQCSSFSKTERTLHGMQPSNILIAKPSKLVVQDDLNAPAHGVFCSLRMWDTILQVGSDGSPKMFGSHFWLLTRICNV